MLFHQNLADKRPKHGVRGITLLEVMIALSVFTVGVIAVGMMLGNAIRFSASARYLTEATEIAQAKLEQLTNAPYNDPELDQTFSPYGPVAVGNYSVTWTVREDVPMNAMKTIKLTVKWKDHGYGKQLNIDAIKQ